MVIKAPEAYENKPARLNPGGRRWDSHWEQLHGSKLGFGCWNYLPRHRAWIFSPQPFTARLDEK